MKTLVIHPKDKTTDFLQEIYLDKNYDTIISNKISKNNLKILIKNHDRIIMMGHGTPSGLIGWGDFCIDREMVYLLKNKECVAIWCNADKFFEYHNLKGLYTAEVEFNTEEECDAFIPLPWFGMELTHDTRYSNFQLAVNGLPINKIENL